MIYKTEQFEISREDNMKLMARYPDNYFDLAIVDPPYGIGKDWKKDKRNVMKHHRSSYNNDSIPEKDYFQELFRVSVNQIIWGANYYGSFLPDDNHWIVWNKGVDYPTQHHSEGELAWHSFNIPLRVVDLLWNGAVKCERVTKWHPHQKPWSLYEWLFKNYAKEGQKILDTHLGSGSIAIALHRMNQIEKMNLHLTACELDQDYYNDAIKRIKQQTAQQTIF